MNIKNLNAIEILDSRGNPTIETTVVLDDDSEAKASVPSGASTGSHEVVELRDGDSSRYGGLGVLKAVNHVNGLILDSVRGKDIEALEEIDKAMIVLDGTPDKSRLGSNAILSVSLACARALSVSQEKPLWQTLNEHYFKDIKPSFPRIQVNLVNGGKHGSWNFDIQEFMVIPSQTSPSESVRIGSEIFHHLGKILELHKLTTQKGDEGGYSPILSSNEEVFDYLERAISTAGYANDGVKIGIDAAATEFCKENRYTISKQKRSCDRQELTAYYEELIKKYKVYVFEDLFAEDDWEGFAHFTDKHGADRLVVGDDLYTTNVERIKKGIAVKATNAVLVKPNQIGTLSETVDAIKLTQKQGWKVIISHRSGETEDSFISDLSYACAAEFLKAGSMSRSERLVKYNRLIEIEKEEIG